MRPRQREIDRLPQLLAAWPDLTGRIVQGLTLDPVGLPPIADLQASGSTWIGCSFPPELESRLRKQGATLFPAFPGALPYRPYRDRLYAVEELMAGWSEEEDDSLDLRIYRHFSSHRDSLAHHEPDLLEALAQRVHDHAIDDALHEFLAEEGRPPVGIMGGHGMSRTAPEYRVVVETARALERAGYLVVSGGGPGIMEAANLGAWLAPHPDDALDPVLDLLAVAPGYSDPGFVSAARKVVESYPSAARSLAVPTWFYGHEPSNLFASHVAKYFSNALREDGLLALCTGGVVYARGSAGTMQEIFMDLCQNHYRTFGDPSPMVFLGSAWWTEETGVWPMVERFAREHGKADKPYRDLMTLCDTADAVVAAVKR